jgi:hypothetical protein
MDLYMMKEIYHCSPVEYSKIELHVLELHKSIVMEEKKQTKISEKRIEQQQKVTKLLNK